MLFLKKERPFLYTIRGFFEKRCLIRYNTGRRAASIASAVFYHTGITIYCTATPRVRTEACHCRIKPQPIILNGSIIVLIYLIKLNILIFFVTGGSVIFKTSFIC